MSLYKVGRLCLKLAGRDAGKKCVIIELLDSNSVIVDGATRRRKVNIKHLEPLAEVLKLKEKASHEEVKNAFEKIDLKTWETKPKKASIRPVKVRKSKKDKSAVEGKPKKAVKAKVKKTTKSKEEDKKEEASVEKVVAEQ